MNKRFQTLSLWILIALALFTTACGAQVVRAEPAGADQPAPNAATYDAMLGKSVKNKSVADFIDSNCIQSVSFQLCQSAGLALWTDPDQIVRLAYLYVDRSKGFEVYKGPLPFGLEADDTMADVEYKLGHPKVLQAPQAGWEPGLPEEGSSPDHTHFSAIYKRFGLEVIYNTASATDKDATIYAILISE